MRFADKVVFVTGAGQGIGRGIARRFVDEGARVVVAEVDRRAGAEAARELGERARFVPTDVAKEASVRKAIAAAAKWGGRLDAVINNAGLADPDVGPVAQLPLATWEKFLAVNLTGPFLVAKHAIPHLVKTRGTIINIGSIRAVMSEPNTEPYAATKGGLAALTHALAISLGPDVRVHDIAPGWIETENAPARSKRDHAQHPVGRVGKPEDIAALCAYLVSDEAGFITGQTFVVDGGMTRKMIYA